MRLIFVWGVLKLYIFFEGSFFKLTLFRYSFLKGYKLRVPYRHLVSWIQFIHNLDNFAVESLNREGEKDFKEQREGLFCMAM